MGDNLILKKVRFFLWHPRIKIIRTISDGQGNAKKKSKSSSPVTGVIKRKD